MSHQNNDLLPLLETKDVTKVYADGQVTALHPTSLEIFPGQYVAVMGPSGSGKSTLLQLLGALDIPTAGEVYFRGQPFSQQKSLDSLRSEQIGFVFQSFYLLPNLTSLENVQMPMFEGTRPSGQRQDQAARLLETVGMGHRTNHRPNQLSVGERQRVAIARALANDPPILLADEPTGNLDSQTGREILNLFDQLKADRGMTIIVVTHDADVAQRAERLIRLRDGRVESDQPVRR